MAGALISDLDPAGSVSDADVFEIEQSGNSKSVSGSVLAAYVGPTIPRLLPSNNLSDVVDPATSVTNINSTFSVATRTLARQMTVSPPALRIGGAASINDGWGGDFILDPADMSTLDDGATCIVISATNARYKRLISGAVEANWFGPFVASSGSGTGTNNQTAIINALTWAAAHMPGGSTVMIPGLPTAKSSTNYWAIGGGISVPANTKLKGWNNAALGWISGTTPTNGPFINLNSNAGEIENITFYGQPYVTDVLVSFDTTADTASVITGTLPSNIVNNSVVKFRTAPDAVTGVWGTLPGGIASITQYFAINVTSTSLQLSLTSGGSAIDLTGSPAGTIYLGSDFGFKAPSPHIRVDPGSLITRVGIKGCEFHGGWQAMNFANVAETDILDNWVYSCQQRSVVFGGSTLFARINVRNMNIFDGHLEEGFVTGSNSGIQWDDMSVTDLRVYRCGLWEGQEGWDLYTVGGGSRLIANNIRLIGSTGGMEFKYGAGNFITADATNNWFNWQDVSGGVVPPNGSLVAFGNQQQGTEPAGSLIGAWVTSTSYSVGNRVSNSGSAYVCLLAHTSGTFATDLAAGKWLVLEIPPEISTGTQYFVVNSLPSGNGGRGTFQISATSGGSPIDFTFGDVIGGSYRGVWTTGTAYIAGDVASNASFTYVCQTNHTSGTFATDLAGGDWHSATAANVNTYGDFVINDLYVECQSQAVAMNQSATYGTALSTKGRKVVFNNPRFHCTQTVLGTGAISFTTNGYTDVTLNQPIFDGPADYAIQLDPVNTSDQLNTRFTVNGGIIRDVGGVIKLAANNTAVTFNSTIVQNVSGFGGSAAVGTLTGFHILGGEWTSTSSGFNFPTAGFTATELLFKGVRFRTNGTFMFTNFAVALSGVVEQCSFKNDATNQNFFDLRASGATPNGGTLFIRGNHFDMPGTNHQSISNTGDVTVRSDDNLLGYATTIPTGPGAVGDVWRYTGSPAGANLGWRCTTAGLAGSATWSELPYVGLSTGHYRAIARTVNFNAGSADTTIPIQLPVGYTRYIVKEVWLSGFSHTGTTATCSLWTAAGGTGTPIVSAATAITVSTASDNSANNSQGLTVALAATESITATSLFFRVETAEGAATTGNVTIVYEPLS